VSVEFELVGWNVQKFKAFEKLIIGRNQLLKYLVFGGITIAVEDDCNVLGLDLL